MRWAGRQYSQQGLAGQGSQGQWERRDKQLLWAKIINDKKSGKKSNKRETHRKLYHKGKYSSLYINKWENY